MGRFVSITKYDILFIKHMTFRINGSMKDSQLWTYEDLSSFMQVKIPTLRKWVFQRRIPVIRLGEGKHRLIRFDPVEITKWLNMYKHPGELY